MTSVPERCAVAGRLLASAVRSLASAVRSLHGDRRGQAFTLEALLAALVLLGTVLFVVEAGGVTALSGGTASSEVTDQHGAVAEGTLDAAIRDGEVRPTLLYWNESNGTFHGVGEPGAYVAGGPPTVFGDRLNRTFDDRRAVFNVDLVYLDESDQPRRYELVDQGTPSDDAVTVSRVVTLSDDDVVRDANGTATNVTLAESTTYFAPDSAPDTPLYNVIRVEVVVWTV